MGRLMPIWSATSDAECQSRFTEKWLKRVESPSYVRLDTLIPGAQGYTSGAARIARTRAGDYAAGPRIAA